jgi:hypothetical protein
VSDLAPDQQRLLEVLGRHGVEFVVVGGVAAQTHGWTGATLDLDIAVSREEANVSRLNAALAELRAGQPHIGALGTSFRTAYGRLEIIRRADGIGEYADWLRNAGEHELAEGLVIVVASPSDILRSKAAAGRDKDLAVLEQMRTDFRDAGSLG